MTEQLRQAALDFHEFPIPGKIEVTPTKSLATQRDLAFSLFTRCGRALFRN